MLPFLYVTTTTYITLLYIYFTILIFMFPFFKQPFTFFPMLTVIINWKLFRSKLQKYSTAFYTSTYVQLKTRRVALWMGYKLNTGAVIYVDNSQFFNLSYFFNLGFENWLTYLRVWVTKLFVLSIWLYYYDIIRYNVYLTKYVHVIDCKILKPYDHSWILRLLYLLINTYLNSLLYLATSFIFQLLIIEK